MKPFTARSLIGLTALMLAGPVLAQDDGAGTADRPTAQERREAIANMTDEERAALREQRSVERDGRREAMRERFENMTEEERQAMREQFQNRDGARPGGRGGPGRGGPGRGAGGPRGGAPDAGGQAPQTQ